MAGIEPGFLSARAPALLLEPIVLSLFSVSPSLSSLSSLVGRSAESVYNPRDVSTVLESVYSVRPKQCDSRQFETERISKDPGDRQPVRSARYRNLPGKLPEDRANATLNFLPRWIFLHLRSDLDRRRFAGARARARRVRVRGSRSRRECKIIILKARDRKKEGGRESK